MTGNGTLIVAICSGPKQLGGDVTYRADSALPGRLGAPAGARLLQQRQRALRWLLDSPATVGDTPIGRLAENGALYNGPDLGGEGAGGRYLPAVCRYDGPFYRGLGSPDERLAMCTQAEQNPMLIVSGLYGVVLPAESVQAYDYLATWDRRIYDLWRGLDGITAAVQAYAASHGVGRIVDVTGDESYRAMVHWQHLARAGYAVYVAETDPAGDARFHVLGQATARFLLGASPEALRDAAEGVGRPDLPEGAAIRPLEAQRAHGPGHGER